LTYPTHNQTQTKFNYIVFKILHFIGDIFICKENDPDTPNFHNLLRFDVIKDKYIYIYIYIYILDSFKSYIQVKIMQKMITYVYNYMYLASRRYRVA